MKGISQESSLGVAMPLEPAHVLRLERVLGKSSKEEIEHALSTCQSDELRLILEASLRKKDDKHAGPNIPCEES